MSTDPNSALAVPDDVMQRLRAEVSAELALDATTIARLKAELRAEMEAQLKREMQGTVAAELDAADMGDVDAFGFPKEYERIVVFEGNQTEDLSYVAVQVNGYALKITRGKEVIVNIVFVDALNAAVEAKPVKTQGGLVTREVHRFPFQRLGKATEAEYQAFRAGLQNTAGAAVH